MMQRYVVIASTARGVIDPPELLDDAGQWLAAQSAESDDDADRKRLMFRATHDFQRERDPILTWAEIDRLKNKPPVSEATRQVERMLKIAGRRV